MRADALRMIADNPSTITITRTVKTITGSKRDSTPTTVVAQTVRLYGKNTTEIQREGDGIRFGRRRELRMLCAYNANVLPKSPTNEDVFTLDSINYLVRSVRPITWNGDVVSKQCTLEERQ